MIAAEELTSLRGAADAALPDTCVIQRPSRVSDSEGGSTTAYPTLATVACRIAPGGQTPQERVIADRIQAEMVVAITMPALTDIDSADRVTSGGRTYEIVEPLAPRSFEVARRVIAREIA